MSYLYRRNSPPPLLCAFIIDENVKKHTAFDKYDFPVAKRVIIRVKTVSRTEKLADFPLPYNSIHFVQVMVYY